MSISIQSERKLRWLRAGGQEETSDVLLPSSMMDCFLWDPCFHIALNDPAMLVLPLDHKRERTEGEALQVQDEPGRALGGMIEFEDR
mmetsp:Transcript_6086/g.14046  ORF Transcript_6086/g.14046 Transcript_6086/m.14046 type:complete len:87 (-) Transcript_6086:173-433(-)